jgi:hypothetical protein
MHVKALDDQYKNLALSEGDKYVAVHIRTGDAHLGVNKPEVHKRYE